MTIPLHIFQLQHSIFELCGHHRHMNLEYRQHPPDEKLIKMNFSVKNVLKISMMANLGIKNSRFLL